MNQNRYTNRAHELQKGSKPVSRILPAWQSVGEFDNQEDLVYRGEIPSIIGKQVTVVRVGHFESLIYCNPEQVEKLKEKYQERFKGVAGVVLRDPKLPPLPRRPFDGNNGQEIDYLAMWADFGLDINLEEEDNLLNKRRSKVKSASSEEDLYTKIDYSKADEGEDEEMPGSQMYERIMKGLNTLLPSEMDLFRLLEKGSSDTAIATTLLTKLESVRIVKGRIYRKLGDYYGATSSQQFFRIIARLYETCKQCNLPVPSDHYSSTVKSRGRYSKKPEFTPGPIEIKQPESIQKKVFGDNEPEILTGEADPPEKAMSQRMEHNNAIEMVDVGPVNDPELIDLLPVWDEAPEADTQKRTTVSFNQFIDAYGNRKDAVKALNEFNKLNVLDRQKAFEFIPKYKESLTNITFQQSPYSYLTGRSWK